MQKIEEKYPESLKSKLENIFGAENVITDQSEMDCQKVDVWWITRYRMFQGKDIPQPYAIVFPENKEQIIELVNYCNIHKLPITPRGGGAGDSGGSIALKGGITVDTKRMDRILKIYDKSLTVRVQPGILQKHLEEYLNRRGYTMNHFPASFHTSTLGGFVSTNGTGILSSKYGKLIDMVHQLEVVLPDGKLFKSLPVNHHSAGPDFSKLFIGAEGTLGIITEILCKIYPLPEKRTFMAFLLPNLKEGIEAGRKIMTSGLVPCIMRFYDETDTIHILKSQYEMEGEGCFFMVGFDGLKDVVDIQTKIASEIISETKGKDLGDKQAWIWWKDRLKSYYPPLDYVCEPWITAVTDTVAPYEDIENVYWSMKSAVENGFKEYGAVFHAHFSHWYDWGTSIYPSFLVKDVPKDYNEAVKLYEEIINASIRASIKNGGVINEHHGIGMRLGRFMEEGYGKESFDLVRKIKKALDPNNIMNPGKFGLEDKVENGF
jgi:alkyldihydroxyacetonephosphate synthase